MVTCVALVASPEMLLLYFIFIEVSEYLDDFVERIDAPLLNHLDIL